MYLIGGPPFSGTTLLALLLSQGASLCLDEPDFHDPDQRHRGIPHLQDLFPDRAFPPPPDRALTPAEAVEVLAACENAIRPHDLGMKTCGRTFVGYACVFRARKLPVIAIVRDIRDALTTAPPPWATEEKLNAEYRMVWRNRSQYDLCIRYEDLVAKPDAVLTEISSVLPHRFEVLDRWDNSRLNIHMLKLERHDRLKEGRIVTDRVGIWKRSGKTFSDATHETAALMGYGA